MKKVLFLLSVIVMLTGCSKQLVLIQHIDLDDRNSIDYFVDLGSVRYTGWNTKRFTQVSQWNYANEPKKESTTITFELDCSKNIVTVDFERSGLKEYGNKQDRIWVSTKNSSQNESRMYSLVCNHLF